MSNPLHIWTGHVLKWEGGYSNHPSDSGGETNKGITLRLFNNIARPVLGISPSYTNFRNLSNLQVMQVLAWFFNDSEAFRIDHPATQLAFLDAAWMSGKSIATRHLQRALQNTGLQVAYDGDFGSETARATSQADPNKLYQAFIQERQRFYLDLVKRRPKDQVFLKGWMNRYNALHDLVTENKFIRSHAGIAAGGLLLLGAGLFLILRR